MEKEVIENALTETINKLVEAEIAKVKTETTLEDVIKYIKDVASKNDFHFIIDAINDDYDGLCVFEAEVMDNEDLLEKCFDEYVERSSAKDCAVRIIENYM